MASAFTAGAASVRREPSKVIRFELRAEDHIFTKLGPDGVTKVPTGEEKPVAKLRGVHADGSVDKLAAWLWMDTADSLDAFIDSARDLVAEALRLRKIGEDTQGWKPRAKPAAAAPTTTAAPKPKGSAFTQAVAKEAAAIEAAPADPFADLPI